MFDIIYMMLGRRNPITRRHVRDDKYLQPWVGGR